MKYRVEYNTTISLIVEVEAEDEDAAADMSWKRAAEYLDTIYGDSRNVVSAEASLDGIGAEAIYPAAERD